jgi:hypothetical protein
LAQFQVVGAIDFAHAAFAEEGDDAVAVGQRGPGDKPRPVQGIGRGKMSLPG